ncbi:MAG: DUF433 domain-containing protein [Bacteroidota bacterium]
MFKGIQSDPDILGGTPVFTGTRVPVKILFDYLETNHTVDEFLDDFPTVSKEAASKVIHASKSLILKLSSLPYESVA